MGKASKVLKGLEEIKVHDRLCLLCDFSLHVWTCSVMFVSLFRISYCTADKMHDKVFAYIVQSQQNETLQCHAFLCTKRKVVREYMFVCGALRVWLVNALCMQGNCMGHSITGLLLTPLKAKQAHLTTCRHLISLNSLCKTVFIACRPCSPLTLYTSGAELRQLPTRR